MPNPIEPKNRTAQLAYTARGNPPAVSPAAAISNCFPGLEFDFRNIWKNLFEGVETHEAGEGVHIVLGVSPGSDAATAGVTAFDILVAVDDLAVNAQRTRPNGTPGPLSALEWSNAVVDILAKAGTEARARCTFFNPDTQQQIDASLRVRPVFDGDSATLAEVLAEPGALTQSLCSPWQADYRECGCFYWSASRPDFVNVTADAQGNARGHNWMQRDKSPGAAYSPDNVGDPAQLDYIDLYRNWEQALRFVTGGRTET